MDRIPMPDPPARRQHGRRRTYSHRLFLHALVVMIARRLPNVHQLLAVLEESSPELQRLRALLTEDVSYPT